MSWSGGNEPAERRVDRAMRAFAIDAFGQGGSVHELPIPTPAAGQVLVRVAAASLNPFDQFVLGGAMKDRLPHHFPLVPGSDLAGTVDAVGPGVSEFSVGDAVFGITGRMEQGEGTLAEFTTASTTTLAHRPDGVGAVQAAALPLTGVSALMCVEEVGPREGDVVVVVGASGSIGGYAVQLATMLGAHVVAVTSSAQVGYVKSLGAAEIINRNEHDVLAELKSRYPSGITAIIDTKSDGPTLTSLSDAVKSGGTVVSMRGSASADELQKRDIKAVNIRTQVTPLRLQHLAELLRTGNLKPGVIHEFPLDRAGEGFELMAKSSGGKVVITI
jgi:NADPH:quinone reductase